MRSGARRHARSSPVRRPTSRSSGRLHPWRPRVLGVRHLLAPVALRALRRSLPDREMGHEVVGRGAVPVPLAGRSVDRVARADLQDLAAAGLNASQAFGDVYRLADGVGVPRIARAWSEADDVDT